MAIVRKSRGLGGRQPLAVLRRQQDAINDRLRKRINRAPSPILSRGVPWVSVMLLSLAPFAPLFVSAPIMPPLAFMALLAWRMLRPGMLPVWAGAPLGGFDDLYSGQPFGSAVLLWSCTMILMELADTRLRWRGFLQDWALAAALIVGYLVLATLISNLTGGHAPLRAIVPQIALSLIAHPLVTRLIAALDRLRLLPLQQVGR
ncbi:rod shape-determining protein MreD [Novosphingobium sp. Gsoil 351]|uniref:rod shape-determining protein MreD n=1 Tax=Novosphingobium sp. Gsoil 351 TaxID=2675225 RepID=UPI0012B4B3E8|nr:rod shape-determining protein MreD [Novosphingobium sp. Gsoil 351]QGN53560.1 rod shape-determining protein MreD [Novosphingobium sp. Gsoil 351]